MDPSDLENLSEEDIKLLMELGIIPEQMGQLDKQMGIAEGLRNTPNPEMRYAGRVNVAANPLEFIGKGLREYAGIRDMKNIQKQKDDLIRQQSEARNRYVQAYLNPKGRMPASAANPIQNLPMDFSNLKPYSF